MLVAAIACFLSPNMVRAVNEPAITESTSISEETGIERDFTEDGVLKSFRFLENNEVIAEFEVEDGNVYQINELGREYIGWVRLDDTVTEADGLNYTEPSWGPMLSTSATVGGANGFGNTGMTIAGLLCAAMPPGVGLTVGALTWLGNEIAASNSSYTRVVTYYREASGCPQYRWYDRVEYYNSSGSRIATTSVNRKSFIGVKNSPDNPPACRAYGF